MSDHTLPPPKPSAVPRSQVAAAGSLGSRGRGSNSQRCSPVRASNASTRPLGASTRWLSATDDPTTTTPFTTAGREVIITSPSIISGLLALICTEPSVPKSSQYWPVAASRANRRLSAAPRNILVAQLAPGCASGSVQCAMPRHLRMEYWSLTSGSKRQRSFPVAGSSAASWRLGVQMTRLPATRLGWSSKAMR